MHGAGNRHSRDNGDLSTAKSVDNGRVHDVDRRIEHADVRLPCSIEHLLHMANAAVGFGHTPQAIPHLAAGDLGAILEHQQQVVAEGLLPGRGPLPPCFRSDRSCCGIDIEAQPHTHAAHTAVRAWARADRIPGKRVASSGASTSRHIVVVDAAAGLLHNGDAAMRVFTDRDGGGVATGRLLSATSTSSGPDRYEPRFSKGGMAPEHVMVTGGHRSRAMPAMR